MAKRCPPGVLCFENITLLIIAVVVIGVGVYLHSRYFCGGGGGHGHGHGHGYGHGHGHGHGQVLLESTDPLSNTLDFGIGGPSSNQDVLLNPYVPPLRDNSVGSTRPMYDIRGGVETIHYGEHGGYGGGFGHAIRRDTAVAASVLTFQLNRWIQHIAKLVFLLVAADKK